MNLCNDVVLESFINFCDDMQIADEGFGDVVKNIGGKIKTAINTVWSAFLRLLKTIKEKINAFFSKGESKKDLKNKNENLSAQIKENEEKIKELQNQLNATSRERDEERSRADSERERADRESQKANNAEQARDNATKQATMLANIASNSVSRKQELNKRIKFLLDKNKELKEKMQDKSNAVDSDKKIKDLASSYRSACIQLDNAIKYGITNHYRYAFSNLKELSELHGPADLYNFKEKNKYKDMGLRSWLAGDNSRPGIHLDYAKSHLDKCEKISNDIILSWDMNDMLKAHIREVMSNVDKLTKTMEQEKKNLESLISTAENIKDARIRNFAISGLQGCSNDWTTIMSVVTRITNVGVSILKL